MRLTHAPPRRLALRMGLLLCSLCLLIGRMFASISPALFSGVALVAPPPQEGVSSGNLSLEARAGFDGLCKDSRFIPLRIIIANSGAAVRGEVLISPPSQGPFSTLYTYPLELASTARKELRLAIHPEIYINELDVRLRVDGKIVLAQKVPVRCLSLEQTLVGVLAGNPSALNSLAEYPAGARNASLARLELADIPDHAQYLEALDVLLVSDLDSGALRPAQVTAIEGWLASGGQLLVMGGAGWQKAAAGFPGLLPVQPDGRLDELNDLTFLADFAQVEQPPGGAVLAAPGSLAEDASLLLSHADQPLAASRPVGYGRAMYLAFDLASEPLRSWAGAPQLLAALLEPAPARPAWSSGFVDPYQAASALKTLPSLNLVGIGWLVLFLVLYTLSIGPLNYIFLHSVKRRELAWVTIPALTIVFTLAAFLLGGRSRGSLPVLSRLSFVQVWPDQAAARLDGMLGIFSPTRRSYALTLAPRLVLYPLRDSGMQAPSGGYDLVVAEDGSLGMPNLRLDVAEMAGQAVGGMLPAPRLEQDLTLLLDSASPRLSGKITNTSGVKLENVVLLAPGVSQALGDLDPGAELFLDVNLNAAASPASTALPGVPGGMVPYYAYPASSSTVETLVGGSDYYANADLFRRFSLLSAIAGYNSDFSQVGGYSLAAWSSVAAFDASLNTQFASDDLTLYLFTLQPELSFSGDTLTLPPALFRWSLPPGSAYSGSDRSPYNGYLYGSEPLFFDFQLVQAVDYAAVKALTLHLKGSPTDATSASLVRLQVSLWDFTRSAWVEFDPLPFGDHAMNSPERYLGPGGAIRLRLAIPDQATPIYLQQADFSLQVQLTPEAAP